MSRYSNSSAVETFWTSDRVRRLRGSRTQKELGSLIGVPKNTVWRWEAGYTRPDRERSRLLSRLAERERFQQDWELAGSATLLGDLEEGSRHILKHLSPKLQRSSRMME